MKYKYSKISGIKIKKPTEFQYKSRKILGNEFKIGRYWNGVFQCACGDIQVLKIHYIKRNLPCDKCLPRKKKPTLSSNTFGTLHVCGEIYGNYDSGRHLWYTDITCECGWKGRATVDELLRNQKSHMKCPMRRINIIIPKSNPKYYITGRFWSHITHDAKDRDIPVEITIGDIWNKYLSQNSLCAITGCKLNLEELVHLKKLSMINASLDRIDSSLGYLINNIQWTLKWVNISKWIMSQQLFIDLCYLVATMSNKILPPIYVDISSDNTKNLSKYWSAIIKRSKSKRQIQVTMNKTDIWDLYAHQGYRCAITGMPIYFNYPRTASLDRIDSSQNYSKNNTQLVHKYVNFMKSDYTENIFLNRMHLVSEYNKNNISQDADKLLNPATTIIL